MSTLHKSYGARFKTVKDSDGNDTGEVTAIVSVFGNVDVVGDRVVKGAFAKTLGEWKESGDPIPMVWSHDWSNPMSHIGEWDSSKAVETDEGLELTGKVDLDSDNPIAKQAFHLMKSRRVREFSFAYDVNDEQKAEDGANELLDLGLIEAGPTLKGANSATRLLAAKALVETLEQESGEKVGRAISAKTEQTLREAVDSLKSAAKSLDGVLSSIGGEEKADLEPGGSNTTDTERHSEDEPVTEPDPVTEKPADKPEGKSVLALLEQYETEALLSKYSDYKDSEDTDSDE